MSKLQPVCVWFSLVFTVSKYGYHLACCPRHHWVIFILLNAPVSSQQNKAYGLLITTEALMRTPSFCALKTTWKKVSGKPWFRSCFEINLTPRATPEEICFPPAGGFYSCSDGFNSTRCTASSAFCQLQLKLIFSDKDAGWFLCSLI